MHKALALIPFLLGLTSDLMVASAQAQTVEGWEQQTERRQLVPLSLYWKQYLLGDLTALMQGSDKLVSVDSSQLMKYLKTQLDEASFATLQKLALQKRPGVRVGHVAIKDLRAQGIKLKYHVNDLYIEVELDSQLLKQDDVSLAYNLTPEWSGLAREPSPFSGYLNQNIIQGYSHGNGAKQPLQDDFELAINWHQWVLESNVFYRQDFQHEWQRGDTRIVHDLPSIGARFSAGDLLYPNTNFLQTIPLAGVQIARDFSITPYLITTPLNQQSFVLKEDARVQVYINGQMVRIMDMSAGKHLLKDLPLNQGLNEIRLDIETVSGRKERLDFPATTSLELLAKGVHQYYYHVGVRRTEFNGLRHYNQNDQGVYGTAYHRYGKSANLSLGHYIQAYDQQVVIGSTLGHTNRFGNWGLELAGSQIREQFPQGGTGSFTAGPKGIAIRPAYSYSDYRGPVNTQRNLRLQLSYLSPYFSMLENLTPARDSYYTIELSYGQNITPLTYAALGSSYSVSAKPDKVSPYGVNLTLGRTFFRYLNANVQLSQLFTSTGQKQQELFAFFNFYVPEKSQYMNAYYASNSNEKSLAWNYNPPGIINKFSAQAEVNSNPDRDRYRLRGQYAHQYYLAEVNHRMEEYPHSGKLTQEGRVGLRTAIAWAGQHPFNSSWGISRPITNSFALVDLQGPWKRKEISIGDYEGPARTQTGLLSHAVIPNLQSYRYQKIFYDTSKLPIGLQLKEQESYLIPYYKSGHLIEINSPPSISVIGRLLDATGQPLALLGGELIGQQSDPNSSELDQLPLAFFTDRKGQFFVEGAKPGHYLMIVAQQDQWYEGHLEIPEGTMGLHHVNKINVQAMTSETKQYLERKGINYE